MVVTAVYDRQQGQQQPPVDDGDKFDITAPFNIRGDIFSITSAQTKPEGPFVLSGSFALNVRAGGANPQAELNAYFISVREALNQNIEPDSQSSRDHDTFQIVDFEPDVALPVGKESFFVAGTADLLLDGDMYSNDEEIEVMVHGGSHLAATSVEIEFLGDEDGNGRSGADRLEVLHGVVTEGFK